MTLLHPVVAWNDAELWVRLPSVIAAVIAAIATYRLGRRLAGRYAGAAASLVLASSLGAVLLSRTVGPLALALAAMLLSTALFARAVDRGSVVWWVVYAISAALLPLTHPIAASALAAQIVALVIARREVELRLAIPAVAVATLESVFFLTAAVVDRADAADGAGPLSLHDIGLGVGRALGWSPVVAALAVWGVIVLVRRSRASGTGLWQPVLVAGLALMPLASVLVAGVALPVFPRTALTVAAGGVALAAGVGLVSIPDRGLRLASGAAVAVVAIAALATAAAERPKEDWRAAARHVRAKTTERDTVVVLPERSAAALAYYAPDVRTSRIGRGQGVTVVVAGAPELAVARARPVVSPPRYALLSQQEAGSALVVQRWVRP
jgi:mannosyltransferase